MSNGQGTEFLDYRNLLEEEERKADSIAKICSRAPSISRGAEDFANTFQDKLDNSIKAFLKRRIGYSRADWQEDIRQEFYLRLLKYGPTGGPFETGENLFAWSILVVRHAITDYFIAERQRNPAYQSAPIHPVGDDKDNPVGKVVVVSTHKPPSELAEEKDCVEQFTLCLSDLPPKKEMALLLNKVDGMGQSAIADWFKRTQPTISRWIKDSLDKIANDPRMKDCGDVTVDRIIELLKSKF